MGDTWNPWHGCAKISEGCAHCYVYRRDAEFGRDSSVVKKTGDFDLPVRRKRGGLFAVKSGSEIFACLTSDFFIDRADDWREEAWGFIRARSDVRFNIITKRVTRMRACLPSDWGEGYPNVAVGATVENQRRADERLGEFLALPLSARFIVCEPMLEPLDLARYLDSNLIGGVVAGGESGPDARPLDYRWVLDLRDQCGLAGVGFRFKQTGANFVKDGKTYRIERKFQQSQARRAGIDLGPAILARADGSGEEA